MIDDGKLAQRIGEVTGWPVPDHVSIITDTSDWTRIIRGNVIRLRGHDFVVKGHGYEARFGIGDQPKYWVFNVFDLETAERKILKTVFHEDFNVHIGVFKIHCYRSPEKEARVLEIVRGDDRFMQGYTVTDEVGNMIRIIDFIRGQTLFQHIYDINKNHHDYFEQDLPAIMKKLADCIQAINKLHQNKICHGDIRNDHIIIDADSGKYRWIDFDLNQNVADYDVWSIGNIINYAVGKGITTFKSVLKGIAFPEEVRASLGPEDASAFFEYRIMNLKKLYPYISDRLGDILQHFTIRPKKFYANMEELLEDYHKMLTNDFGD